jgi:pyrimidine operon attenuation protein/uracil phosphoribosyltransferase
MSKKLLDKKEVDRALTRISHEVIEKAKGGEDLCLAGIQRGGVHIAQRLARKIAEAEKTEIPVGSLDISFYRDDLKIRAQPVVSRTEIEFDVTGKKVILVDDVFFTGRSIRAAMDAIFDIGRPSSIQLAVLIDRGHRQLPIRADYVGKNIPTSMDERVDVLLEEDGHEDGVVLRQIKLEEDGHEDGVVLRQIKAGEEDVEK